MSVPTTGIGFEPRRGLMRNIPAACAVLVAAASGTVHGAEIFVPNPLEAIYDGMKYEGRNDLKGEIRLVGARNGAFSAQVVVYSASPAEGPRVRVGDLKHASGSGVIPASAIEVRYAVPSAWNGSRGRRPAGNQLAFDGLTAKPRTSGTTHPVWITVNVPKETVPGDYSGTLSVAGREVPVRLSVADWRIPDPADFETWADFIESPESAAMRYNVEFWSSRHWELLGKVFAHLARVGNKTLYIPLICRTNLGNAHSMVRVARRGEDVLEYDFSIMEKYLDVALQNMGAPKVVCFYVWDIPSGGQYFSSGTDRSKWIKNPVSMYDPASGKTTGTFESPRYCEPEEAEKFWKPVAEGIRERMKMRGLGKAVMLGLPSDVRPAKEIVDLWKKLLPEAQWVIQSHGLEAALHGVPVGHSTTVWKAGFPCKVYLERVAKNPAMRTHGWMNRNIQGVGNICYFARDIHCVSYSTQLAHGRLLGEMNILGAQRGFGRMSADFWPCVKDDKGRLRSISARFPETNWNQLNLSMTPYIYPADEGPQTTVRFEMLKEGMYESEAVILLDRAVTLKEQKDRLGEDLAEKCQVLVDERIKVLASFNDNYADAPDYAGSGWQDRSMALYSLAAAVSRALGEKK
ncbi:MAG: hypothetical protein N3A38_08875 [Planctomycetota bacterium]|nr:hypothetical protein [Planctomycetota bacterium]